MNGQNGRRPAHRPARYDAGPEGFAAFQADTGEYLRTEEVQTVRTWLEFLQISKMTLSNYRKRSEAWTEFIEDTRRRILEN